MFSFWIVLACTAKQIDSAADSAADTSAELETEAISWEIVEQDIEKGALMSIWESADGVLFSVGGQFDQGLILQKNGADFTEMVLPEGTPLLNWIHGESAVDFWVGGLSGTILHWDGENWQDYSLEIEEAIWGIHQANGSVFCVGGESRWGGETARIFSLEDDQFVERSIPEQYEALGNLFKIGYWDDTFWAIGAAGALISIEEDVLSAVPTGLSADLVTIHQNQIVGGRGVGIMTTIEEIGQVNPAQLPAGLNGVFQYEAGKSVVVGERGYAALYDQAAGEYQEIDPVTLDILHAVSVDQNGDAYAVGGNLFTTDQYFHGVILRLKGIR